MTTNSGAANCASVSVTDSVASDYKPFRVLSLDGGGIRGLYTATLLQQLTVRLARLGNSTVETRLDLGRSFDLIVGTSTGAILATALAAGVALEDIVALYCRKARQIFQHPMPSQEACFFDRVSTAWWVFRLMRGPANNSSVLWRSLTDVLGDETLAHMYARRKIGLCVPTVNAATHRAWVFKTPHAKRLTRDNNYRLTDVCMTSAAAPLYFPMHGIQSPDSESMPVQLFVDGGLWANDPVLVALAEALELAGDKRPIQLLSVGTCPGNQSEVLQTRNASRGLLGWLGGTSIVTMSIEAQSSVTHYLATKVVNAMGGRVTLHRLAEPDVSPEEATHLALDSPKQESLDDLQSLALRATDMNMSELTNSGKSTKEHTMTIEMLSNLNELPRKDK